MAKRAGVSPGTVSNVMNRRRATDDEIAQRVKQAARDLGYQPDRAASNLRLGKARVVAVLVPEIDNPFFSKIVAEIESLAQDEGFELFVGSSGENEEVEASRLAAMMAWRPVGVIVIPTTDSFANHQLITATGTPFVVVDRTTNHLIADTVSVNNRLAGMMAFDHLADLGIRKVLIVASSLKTHNMRERCDGALSAAAAHGLNQIEIVELGADYQLGSEILYTRLTEPDRPEAILAMTNMLTLSTLSAAVTHGISIPEHLALLGFDDYAWMLVRKTPITAVSQPLTEIAEAAWTRLKERIAGDSGPPQSICFDCQLNLRASTLGFRKGKIDAEAEQAPVHIRSSLSA